jgi:hypothetical protein
MLWETLANASEDMASAIYFVAKGRTDMNFNRILYSNLNSRQKEAFNFQKVSAVLADYGFITIRLSSDWGGADFIAQHCCHIAPRNQSRL